MPKRASPASPAAKAKKGQAAAGSEHAAEAAHPASAEEAEMVAKFAGNFKAHTVLHMGEMKMNYVAKSKGQAILGGNFVEMTYDAEMPGMGPFHGKMLLGFSPGKGEYEQLWIDTMSKDFFVSRGKPGKGKKKNVIELLESRIDAKTQKPKDTRMTYDLTNPENIVCKSFASLDGAKEVLEMEINYERI